MSTEGAVFVAGGGAGAGAPKRRKKKTLVVEEDEAQPGHAAITQPQTQPEAEPEQESRQDSDDDGPNPLAEAMGQAAAAVAAGEEGVAMSVPPPEVEQPKAARAPPKKKSNLAATLGSSSAHSADLNDAAASLSSYANAGSARSASSANNGASSGPARKRDEFDEHLDLALGGRNAASATSSGYIDPADLRTIERAQKSRALPHQDEFEFEEVADVTSQSLAAPAKSGAAFDEFADVWDAVADPAAAKPVRKVLKASKDQKKIEKPDAKEEARLRQEAELKAALERAEQAKADQEQLEQQGLQNATLAKLGIAPTNILAQYDSEKLQPSAVAVSSKPAATKKPREQDLLESNDAALAAASSPSAPGPSNVVEALVNAHTSSAPIDVSQAHVADQLDQWGAVNSLREKQAAAARAEADRAAKQGRSIGIKQADAITRDTPIHYDAALKALTVEPSCPSSYVADPNDPNAAASSPPPPTAVQIATLKQRIRVTDFRDVGMAKSMRYALFAPKLKSPRLEDERDLVFCMAQMQIDYNHCVDHERILCSLYRGLTGDALAPPTFGNHWQVIGFQANDPATDLRGGGLFSLIQLLWFMKHHRDLMLRIYALSLDDRQNFPFCTLSTNITGMALQALRECTIYGECKRQGSVFAVVHTLYVAAFYEMYLKWKSDNCTIMHWNDVKQYLEKVVLRTPKQLMAKFKANIYALEQDQQQQGALEFTEIP